MLSAHGRWPWRPTFKVRSTQRFHDFGSNPGLESARECKRNWTHGGKGKSSRRQEGNEVLPLIQPRRKQRIRKVVSRGKKHTLWAECVLPPHTYTYADILPPVVRGGPLGHDEVLRAEPPRWDECPYKGDPREPPHTPTLRGHRRRRCL